MEVYLIVLFMLHLGLLVLGFCIIREIKAHNKALTERIERIKSIIDSD